MSATSGRGLFDILIAEMELDLQTMVDGVIRDETTMALVGLRRTRDSFPLKPVALSRY